jgi:hypothetical protein
LENSSNSLTRASSSVTVVLMIASITILIIYFVITMNTSQEKK